jgi:hypothetical protein
LSAIASWRSGREPPGSAAARRFERNAAIVAAHPHWVGIRHPELIPFPHRRRYSKLDMLPGAARSPVLAAPSRTDRVARTREIVAAHPRWRGITHPDRIIFPAHVSVPDPLTQYRNAVLRAVRGVRESERLCAEISGVADAVDRRAWPWAASPEQLQSTPPSRSRPSNGRRLRRFAAKLRPHHPARLGHVRATIRPIAH